jgi:2-polyprenyl-6-methoxyphenol hydroxylase-like FAD-dependent oxidoreductase
VGDAGYAKDPITAQGISDAFIDAESLATALHAVFSSGRPFDEALGEYQVRRDQRARPMYEFTCQLATLKPPPPPLQQLFSALRDDREETSRFYSALTGATPLAEFMNPENIGRIVARAAAQAGHDR